jgi:hypothetical protein
MHMGTIAPMRRSGLILVFLLFVAVSAQAAEPAAGKWVGSIARAEGPLKVEVDLWQRADGRWGGDMSIPDQGAKDLPLEVDVTAKKVMFRIVNIPGEPPFVGKLEGDTIDGEFQAAEPYALTLMRVVEEAPQK